MKWQPEYSLSYSLVFRTVSFYRAYFFLFFIISLHPRVSGNMQLTSLKHVSYGGLKTWNFLWLTQIINWHSSKCTNATLIARLSKMLWSQFELYFLQKALSERIMSRMKCFSFPCTNIQIKFFRTKLSIFYLVKATVRFRQWLCNLLAVDKHSERKRRDQRKHAKMR